MQYTHYIWPVVTKPDEKVPVSELPGKRKEQGAYSHPQWLRLRFIERQLLWERKLTTTMLMETFGISRPQAQKDIKLYLQMARKNVKPYDLSIPYHQASESFSPILLSEADLLWNGIEEYAAPSPAHAGEVPMLPRKSNLEVLSIILSAIEHRRSIEAIYASITTPEGSKRLLTPHAVAHVNNRFHVRAYCWDRKDYRDFSIGRFRTTPTIRKPVKLKNLTGEHPAFDHLKGVPPIDDTPWNTLRSLDIRPNPRLSPEQQNLIAKDYQLENNENVTSGVEVRAALLGYFLTENRIPTSSVEYSAAIANPVAYPVLAFDTETQRPAHEDAFKHS